VQAFVASETKDMQALQQDYAKFYAKQHDAGEATLASALAGSRAANAAKLPKDKELLTQFLATYFVLKEFQQIVDEFSDIKELQKDFSRSRPESNDGWSRTPTVVYSRSLGQQSLANGGHNVDARTIRIVRDPDVVRGTVKPGEKGEFRVNPEDAPAVESNARGIARSKNPEDRIKASIQNAVPERERPRDQILATTGYRAFERGFSRELLPSAGNGIGPPPPPPRVPGTLPSAEPPENEGRSYTLGANASETIHVNLKDGMATLRRVITGDRPSPSETFDYCDARTLAYLIAEARDGGGRAVDFKPYSVVFDEGVSDELADRVIENLSLHESRAGEERLTILSRRTFEALEPIQIVDAKVAGEISVAATARAGIDGAEVKGSVDSVDTSQTPQRRLRFEVFVADAQFPEKAQATVNNVVQKSKGKTLAQFAPDLYMALIQDLKGSRIGSSIKYNFADLGDFRITEFKTPPSRRQLVTTARP
jgi:hypothetical protein